ncbi:thioredoxin family protein [Spirosoma pulveris]
MQLNPIDGINFESGDWQSVLAKAKQENKLIFLDLFTTWCGPCKWMDQNVYSDAKVGKKYNAAFVNYKTDAQKGEGIELAQKFNVQAYPSYFFVNADEDVVFVAIGGRPVEEFIALADEALSTRSEKPLAAYQAEYELGNRDGAFIKAYLKRLKQMEQPYTDVINDYLACLPAEQREADETLKLLLDYPKVMVLNSRAHELYQANQARVHELMDSMQENQAPPIAIAVMQTLRQARQQKDADLFEQAATLLIEHSGRQDDIRSKEVNQQQAFSLRMDFYRHVGSAPKLIEVASKYLDSTPMTLSLAGIQQRDQELYEEMMGPFLRGERDSSKVESFEDMKAYYQSAYSSALAMQLNQGAWAFYELVDEPELLEKALNWAKRSLNIQTHAANLDTYAHLLYKLGRRQEAIEWQTKAVEAERDTDQSNSKETLEKMKAGTL